MSRKYAYQVLLIEEFGRHGVETRFLNAPSSATAEDQLETRLVQFQGMIAEGAIGFDAVKHLVLCRLDHRPPRLDLAQYPHLPAPRVTTTMAADYLMLLGAGAE